MMYLSEDLIQLEHYGLGQYTGHEFSTLVNPNRIQQVRIKGPRIKTGINYIDEDPKTHKVYQVIYSNKGYTESFVICKEEYIELVILLALKEKGLNYYEQHFDKPKIMDLVDIAIYGKKETHIVGGKEKPIPTYPDLRPLIAYIRKHMED